MPRVCYFEYLLRSCARNKPYKKQITSNQPQKYKRQRYNSSRCKFIARLEAETVYSATSTFTCNLILPCRFNKTLRVQCTVQEKYNNVFTKAQLCEERRGVFFIDSAARLFNYRKLFDCSGKTIERRTKFRSSPMRELYAHPP